MCTQEITIKMNTNIVSALIERAFKIPVIKSDESLKDYLIRMFRAGYKKLGKGLYSTVYENPMAPTPVVKIGTLDNNEGSVVWLKWCINNKNKFVPKVYGLYLVKNSDGKIYFIAFMEKLDKVKSDRYLYNFSEAKGLVRPETSWVGLPFCNRWTNAKSLKGCNDQALKTVLTKLALLAKKYHLDMQGKNSMIRGEQLVFVDPFYAKIKSK